MDDKPGYSSKKAGMKIFRHLLIERLPARKDWIRLFMVVSAPIHIWAWVMFLYDLPGYMLRLNIWQILVVLAYVLVFTLFESIAATLVLTLLVWLIPTKIGADGYSLQGSVFLMVAVLLAGFIHLQRPVVTALNVNLTIYLVMLGIVFFISLTILIGLSLAVHRQPKVAERALVFMDRFTLLSVIYLVLDGMAVCLIALRILTAVIS